MSDKRAPTCQTKQVIGFADCPPSQWTTFTHARFTTEDVCRIVGITPKQLEHVIDPARAVVRVSSQSRQRRQGLRRMFSGADILKIAAVFAVNAVGFPMRHVATLADHVERRVRARLDLSYPAPGLELVAFPSQRGGDWRLVCLPEGCAHQAEIPFVSIVIRVDALIDETLEALRSAVSGSEQTP